MHDWLYVALAYLVVWGAIALYTWALKRRIVQARAVAEYAGQVAEGSPGAAQEGLECDAPPAP